ncbi:MAG: hypothetical protein AAFV53_24110 [Myxococcota bacterium]
MPLTDTLSQSTSTDLNRVSSGQDTLSDPMRSETMTDPLSSGSKTKQNDKTRVVNGSGNYTYEQYPDGSIVIVSGPGVSGPVRLSSGSAFDAITAEIGPYPSVKASPKRDEPTETETAPVDIPQTGGWFNWLAEQTEDLGEGASELLQEGTKWFGNVTGLWTSDTTPTDKPPVSQTDTSDKAHEVVKKDDKKEKTVEGTGTPLETALDKVGEVDYVDPTFGKGDGKRKFTKDEVKNLKQGSDDLKVASCSPFAYWSLAASGIDINSKIEGEDTSIRAYINLEKSALAGGKYMDLIKDKDDRIKGAATAFEKADIGTEVEQDKASPGDYVQTFSKKGGGHSTIVHRAHCTGAAIFNVSGSPQPVGFSVDGTGPQPRGFDGESVTFIIDESTDPATVGEYTSDKVELLGAHLGGTNSDDEKEDPGVYTKKAKALSAYHRAFVGRLSTSVWSAHTPAKPESFLDE